MKDKRTQDHEEKKRLEELVQIIDKQAKHIDSLERRVERISRELADTRELVGLVPYGNA